ncbi:MAG TPA: hypothetical protein VGM75_08235 [Pseudonocardiaceae bacterium]
MSDENQSPEQPTPEQPASEQEAKFAQPAPEAGDEPTVREPVQGHIPPAAVPLGAVPPGAIPPQGAVPSGYYYPPGMPMARPQGGFGRFVRHRATQLVAAAVLGLLIGGGTIAIVDSASAGPGYGHHHYTGNYGPGYGGYGGQGGQGFGRQLPNGN